MQMDGIAKQKLHGFWPAQSWICVDYRLQIAILMGQAQLTLLSGCFQLGAITITPPNLSFEVGHDIFDHILAAIETDHMQNGASCTKHPFPPIIAFHSAGGLVAVDHSTLLNLLLDKFNFLEGLLPRSLHNIIDATLTDLYPMQVLQSQLGAL